MRRTPPKARMILDLLEQYEGPLTSDFRRFYHLRLTNSALEIEADEFIDLVQWLPSESAFVTSAQSKGDLSKARSLMGWTTQDDLMIALLNLINHQTYVIARVAGDKRAKPPKQIENPRTSQVQKRGSGGDASAFARALLAQQKG